MPGFRPTDSFLADQLHSHAAVVELVDTGDLKSPGRKAVRVRLPPAAQKTFSERSDRHARLGTLSTIRMHKDPIPFSNCLWIGPDENEARQNGWYCFRRTFTVEAVPRRATVRIAVDSKYVLFVNGKTVLREGGLKRGPSPDATYFDIVDLAPFLGEGKNVISILLRYFGRHGFSHVDSRKPGLLLCPESDSPIPKSDGAWKAMSHPAYSDTGLPRANFRLPESNVRYDARKDIGNWTDTDYDDSSWRPASVAGPAGSEPWGALVERPIPQFVFSEPRDFVSVREHRGLLRRVIRAKLPYHAQFQVILDIVSRGGSTIDIRTDTYRRPYPIRFEYVTKPGRQTFETPAWMSGEEAVLRMPTEARLLGIRYRESGYDAIPKPTPPFEDPFLERLWMKSSRTVYLNMRDHFTDCPDRERAQWFGDLTNAIGTVCFGLDGSGQDLIRKAFLELAAWQDSDGILRGPVPAGNWDRELPQQMLAAIGYFGLWEYYRLSGDLETLRSVFPSAARYVRLWERHIDGTIRHREGDWDWGDWSPLTDKAALTNMWYALSLKGLALSAEAIGEDNHSRKLEEELRILKAALRKHIWDGKRFRSNRHVGPADVRVQALAILADVATPEMCEALRDPIRHLPIFSLVSPYYERYLTEALFHMGYGDDAIERIRRRFKTAVGHPGTTLPELFIPFAGTGNHVWGAWFPGIVARYGLRGAYIGNDSDVSRPLK